MIVGSRKLGEDTGMKPIAKIIASASVWTTSWGLQSAWQRHSSVQT